MHQILIATGNKGKVREFQELLNIEGIEFKSLQDFPSVTEPEEDGSSFSENAKIKAVYYSKAFSIPALADDSGLCVDAIDGKPGIFSARFAGKGASDEENIAKLLAVLGNIDSQNRGARFECVVSIANSQGVEIVSEQGNCPGMISRKPYGFNGFGYDPVFRPEGLTETFGELPESVKKQLSHRAVAARKISRFLKINSEMLT